jgi:hypothetical protein
MKKSILSKIVVSVILALTYSYVTAQSCTELQEAKKAIAESNCTLSGVNFNTVTDHH